MTPEARLKAVQKYLVKMPSLSTTTAKVLEICNNPDASPNDLNRVIALDPVLTGQILKLINSAYYALPIKIASLTRAIIMLGLNTVKNLVLATSVMQSFSAGPVLKDPYIDTFWEHSLWVGGASKVIAGLMQVPVLEREEFFVSGLLHDLGKLPIMACFPEEHRQARQHAKDAAVSHDEAEKQFLGFDHAHINALIAAKWCLANSMSNAMVNHHHPFDAADDPDDLSVGVALANCLFHHGAAMSPPEQNVEAMPWKALTDHAGLSWMSLVFLKPEIESQIEKARIFLNLSAKG